MNNVFDEFTWRGLVYDATEGVSDVLAREKITVYIGFDPTGDSLQVGNLLTLMGLARMQRFGHTPIALAGGGTGMIGDPSGKAQERQLMTREQVEANVAAIKEQMAHFLDFEVKGNTAQIENNADWLMSLGLVDFLRDVGKHFTVNYMVAKDSVKSRLGREEGISYTEFSYMLLQSYDFVHLFDHHNCVMQSGGSDQWGNITAGIELIRRMRGKRAYGLVYPLITNADGSKLGKTAVPKELLGDLEKPNRTEAGTIWLSPERTSPYRFYQYWLNQDDRDVINFIKYFTWLTQPEIEELAHKLQEHPERREAQRTLAQKLTRTVHGETELAKAEQAARVLFGGKITGLSAEEIQDILADVPSSEVPKSEFEGEGLPLVNLLATVGVATSRGNARRLIEGGGIYVNNVRVSDAARTVSLTESVGGRFLVLRKGKKNYHLVQISQ